MAPRIETHPEADGVRLRDPVERAQEALYTAEPVDPTPCSTANFHFPIDVAAAIETSRVRLPYLVDVWIRDFDGNLVAETCNKGSVEVPEGSYNVDLPVAGVKLYLAVECGFWAGNVDEQTVVRFDDPTGVEIGVRSFHEQPVGTITVTEDPEDLMCGISQFGSALKTTSPERSFPTLRGHPPMLELGDSFEVPDHVERPDVDVRIEVPPEHSKVFSVASLAYYLGAEVVPGAEPRLVAGAESHELAGDDEFGESVGRVLKRLFLFDCVTRTEGYFDVELAERNRVESLLDRTVDFASLYDSSLPEQVNRYLALPTGVVEEVLPRWRMTADLEPSPENAAALPFFADRLALIRRARHRKTPSTVAQPEAVSDFLRSRNPGTGVLADGGVAVQRGAAPGSMNIVWPRETDSFEHVWLADGVPLDGNKIWAGTFSGQFDRNHRGLSTVEITVVVNDESMDEESAVEEIYRNRNHTSLDVTIERDLTIEGLRRVLGEYSDFFHFVGHIDNEGIQCSDGSLDASSLGNVETEAFLLNGCSSFEQGRALLDAGSSGGIVTLDPISNSTATVAGYNLSLMLNAGHSLASATRILEDRVSPGLDYVIIGDGTIQLLNPTNGSPEVVSVADGGDMWNVQFAVTPSNNDPLGTLYTPHISDNDIRFLNIGSTKPFLVSTEELVELLMMMVTPVQFKGEMCWSPDVVSELRDD